MPLAHRVIESPLGPLTALASNAGLCALEFEGRVEPREGVAGTRAEQVLNRAEREVREYFAGRLKEFGVPLELHGTPWQHRVWGALLGIPYGETRSYADIARALGNPEAAVAVGQANGANPIAIVVPCHRVIAADGSLHGYGGGLDRKRRLLDLEGATTPGALF